MATKKTETIKITARLDRELLQMADEIAHEMGISSRSRLLEQALGSWIAFQIGRVIKEELAREFPSKPDSGDALNLLT